MNKTGRDGPANNCSTKVSKSERSGLLPTVTFKMPKKIVKKSRSQKFLDVVFSLIPILGWLPKYKLKDNLVYDAIGGMTVGIMSVPQGMAYATLVGLPPANGLYTSLFPPIIYMIFGTSRHVSLGVFAVVSLLTGSCNIRVTEIIAQERNITVSFDDPQITAISVSIVTSLALLVGIIQITMGLARLDFLTTYLSEQIVQGFMTGAAFHVFTAQINKILGVPLPRRNGFGKFFFMYYDFAMRLINDQQNNYTIIASVVCLILLFSAKQWIGPLCAKCCKIPIPIDLFVVIFGTLISHMLHFSTKFGIKVVGNIPTGIPAPAVPDITLFHYFVSDAFALAIIILVVTISMGKQFALKHSYEIDVRQEFFALGIVETVSSFLPCWPSSTALARTLVYEAAGTKTQCFLACIVIVALKGMFMQLQQISFLWKRSKLDCAVFMITLVATVVSDILPGLLIGTVAGALLVFYRFQA
ncbi:unnamed protein product [Caenorhabditis auriculariae]|uniref:SLC26A/SulP transporter domain-containing protein n=1 Tax=Caenorhabditis auriculariae TaxID=2777116 RepID=A0A8S1HFM5_9PELO|nr:unnamed protein product [Caenorhabditis auriculariae]